MLKIDFIFLYIYLEYKNMYKMKQDVHSILMANLYLTKCLTNKADDNKKDVARKFLYWRIQDALSERSRKKKVSSSDLIFV